MLYNYICENNFHENNFHAFSAHKHIFTTKTKRIVYVLLLAIVLPVVVRFAPETMTKRSMKVRRPVCMHCWHP